MVEEWGDARKVRYARRSCAYADIAIEDECAIVDAATSARRRRPRAGSGARDIPIDKTAPLTDNLSTCTNFDTRYTP